MSPEPQPTTLRLFDLVEVLSECEPKVVGDGSTIVSAITEDSRKVTQKTLYVARKGHTFDGVAFAPFAIQAGASAILCERQANVFSTPRIEVSDLRQAWGICAHELYRRPADSLTTIGVTGTNGKTTVAQLVGQTLEAFGVRVGRIGTLGFFLDGKKLEESLTTPQPDQLARAFARVRDAGGRAIVMEVSSHALDQKRTAGVRFSSVAFTNLTQDHLDYHKTMEEYASAKARLFRQGDPEACVLNVDDEFGRRLARELPRAITVSAKGRDADFSAISANFGRDGLNAVVRCSSETLALSSPLLGRHNLENLLVSWGILSSLGHPAKDISEALKRAQGVPGRLERCDDESDDVAVVVDYAHTPDALSRALGTLSDLKFTEVVCVFGCGGDRDRSKRAPMGRIAALGADRVVLTSDNPRSEDPLAIIADVEVGLDGAISPPIIEADRRTAIEGAIQGAKAGAVVLIAGKGHEAYQLVGSEVLSFDDRVEARRALALRRARKGS